MADPRRAQRGRLERDASKHRKRPEPATITRVVLGTMLPPPTFRDLSPEQLRRYFPESAVHRGAPAG